MTDSSERAILLISGGLDSVAAAHLLPEGVIPALGLTVDYGQKAARQELAAAFAVCTALEVPHRTVFLPYMREATAGALTDPYQELPEPSSQDLDDPTAAAASAAAVWVPNRNLSLIAMAATWAEVNEASYVVVGLNREEAATFPDNSRAFLDAVNATLALSTRNGVKVLAPTIDMTKPQIVAAAREAGAPLHRVWSCYRGDDEPCGRCESCSRFLRALDEVGVPRQGNRAAPPQS